MSGTLIVDLFRWRAEHSSPDAGPAATAAAPETASATATGPADASAATDGAAVIDLTQASAARARAGGPGPGPASAFGPVMAFGLVRRPEAAQPAAVGDEAVPVPARARSRARHLSDARGATRGPGR